MSLDHPLSSADQGWLENLGCLLPMGDEDDQFKYLNQLVQVGSIWINDAYNIGEAQVLKAREEFLDLLTNLDNDTREDFKQNNFWSMPLDTIVYTQRVLRNAGIDAAKVVNAHPPILSYAPESVREKLDNLMSAGIDAAKVVNAFPSILGYAPESVREKLDNLMSAGIDAAKVVNAHPPILSYAPESIKFKLRVLYSAARAWGVNDYRTPVNRIVEDAPILLSLKPDRNRILIRIINDSLQADSELSVNQVKGIVINKLESTLASYLEHRGDIHTLEDIVRKSRQYKKLGKDALICIIDRPEYANDRAVRIYKRAYNK